MEGCLFCAIAEGKLTARIVYEDERVVAFHDVMPQAPVHLLVIPREHVSSCHCPVEATLWDHLMGVVRTVADQLNLKEGYRLVVNCGMQAGQTVPHLHIHLLSGRMLQWPPG